MFIIHHPPHCQTEIHYIADVIFHEFLGMEYKTVPGNTDKFVISAGGRSLKLPDIFFSSARTHWLKPESLPQTPLPVWNTDEAPFDINLVKPEIPIIFGKGGYSSDSTTACLDIDIFGSAFFMLSRYEELVKPDRDAHDRFPATASLAWQEGFLDRPIVNEYIEILWACLKNLYPGLKRRPRKGEIRVTCDVDTPFDPWHCSFPALCLTIGADLVIRRDIVMAKRRLRNFFAVRQGDYSHDSCYTFDWYMTVCEKAGRKANFYFVCDHSGGRIDGYYGIFDEAILKLLQTIDGRGHELGMHGSYNSFRSAKQLLRERQRMIEACNRAGVSSTVAGNRQHFLRWDSSVTPDCLEKAGFTYDTTGAFADRPGFRYGTAKSFSMWDWTGDRKLILQQQPLIMMECSVIAPRYLDLGYTEQALDVMLMLRNRALKFGGDFTLLWHNSHLTNSLDREFFEALIS